MLNLKAENITNDKFSVLFGSLLIFFAGVSLFDYPDNSIVLNILIFQVFAAAVYTVSKHGKSFRSALLVGAVFVILRIAEYFLDDESYIYQALSIIVMVAFMSIIIKSMLVYLLETKEVNLNLILGVISGYLMLGVIFSFGFSLIMVLSDNPISFQKTPEFKEILYFTMITQTTIGYGDVAPVSNAARFLSYSLGIIGQLYMGIVMAFIIGKFLQPKENTKKH